MHIPEILPNWIDGQAIIGEQTLVPNQNYKGELLCQVSWPSSLQIEQTLKAARRAQKAWAEISPSEKAKILKNCAKILRENNDLLAKTETLDTGRPIRETLAVDIVSGADCFEYFASIIENKDFSRSVSFDTAEAKVYRRPLGVCVGLGAWNYPLQIACWKAAPALACGNAVVFKPSEATPLSSYFLAEITKKAGLPDGLFNVLQGDKGVGSALVESPYVDKVSLTGSVETGKLIYRGCSSTLKKISLEMGGKSPFIVFEDSDLKKAVQGALLGNFYSSGQICSNGTRVFVQSSIKKQFEKILLEECAKIVCGDPLDPRTQMGPLIHSDHTSQVMHFIEQAKKSSAVLLYGGDKRQDGIISPTVFTDCEDHMSHCVEEIFGPVMSLLEFVTEQEVIERSNKTPFGLAAGVYTNDPERAQRVARQLKTGVCWINCYNITPVEVPFGGSKLSGIGRENGIEAIYEYTEAQTIYAHYGDSDSF